MTKQARRNHALAFKAKPDRDAQFVTRLFEANESIATIAADVAPCSHPHGSRTAVPST
jgi:hypothetical protein